MAFKDYEDLDVTRETATEEELESLRKKYGLNRQYGYKAGIRRILTCLGIAIILTMVTMILYSNILVVDFKTTMIFGMLYWIIFFVIIAETYTILLKRKNIKEDIWLLISMIDMLILITAFIIGVLAPISIILKEILLIITCITFILFVILIVVGKILGILK